MNDSKIEIQVLNEVIDKLSKQQSKMYTEEEVKELLETQRGNSYVAVLYHTKNDDIATAALEAPEPVGGKWVK